MRKLLLVLIAAAVLPAGALAAKPPHPTQARNATAPNSQAAPKVLYVLRGVLSDYTAASGATNGSISITVSGANHYGAALKGKKLTFVVDAKTKIALFKGAAIANGDRGLVKVRAAKKLADPTTLGGATAFQVVDQGAPATS